MILANLPGMPAWQLVAFWLCSLAGLAVFISALRQEAARDLRRATAVAVVLALAPILFASLLVVFPDCSSVDGFWWWWDWCFANQWPY